MIIINYKTLINSNRYRNIKEVIVKHSNTILNPNNIII